jgi:uncharacterized protein (TIGR02246 family)
MSMSGEVNVEERAVRDVLRSAYTAWANNDADAFAALYVDDATAVLPGTYNNGRNELRDYMAAGFAGPLKGSRAIDEPQNVRLLDGGTAIVISEAGILMPGETVLPPERKVRATWVLSKSADRWRIAAYHNCPL